MSKLITDISPIVQNYLDDTSINVDQAIIDTINFLSGFFHIKKLDISKITTIAQNYISKPILCKRVRRLKIDDKEVKKLVNFDDFKAIDNNQTLRWYEDNETIMLTTEPTASKSVEIWYDAKFIIPDDTIETNVPDELMELVYVGACWRYTRKLLSAVITNRENYPDVNPDEIRKILKHWKDEFNDLFNQYLIER